MIQQLRKIEIKPGAYLRLELAATVTPGKGAPIMQESTLLFGECRHIEIFLRGGGLPLMRSVLEELSPAPGERAGESSSYGESQRACSHYRLEFDVGYISVLAMRYSHCITRTLPSTRENSSGGVQRHE